MEKLILLLIIGFSFGETKEFIVNFMGLNSAKVTISVKDTTYKSQNSKSIIYETQTVSGAKTLFPVDNYYKSIITSNFGEILYFEKSTSQPWLENNLKTITTDGKIFYLNSSTEIPKNYNNIFTLLEMVNYIPIKDLLNKEFHIDREGQRYIATFISGDVYDNYQELLLNLDLIKDNINPVIENTDIFTWAVFRDSAERILKIKDGKLVYCEFSLGFVTMRAEIVGK